MQQASMHGHRTITHSPDTLGGSSGRGRLRAEHVTQCIHLAKSWSAAAALMTPAT